MCGTGTPCKDGKDSAQGDLETYSQHVRQVMQAAEWPWPEHVLVDKTKQPRFVHTVKDFMHELTEGDHMDKVVVFPGGLEALGHQAAMNQDVAKAMGFVNVSSPPRVRTGYELLQNLAEAGAMETMKGKACYRESAEHRADVSAGGRKNACMVGKWEALQSKCPDECKQFVYVAEMRRLDSQPCDNGLRKRRRSLLSMTMRERMYDLGMDVQSMPFWDDISEGFFCGSGCTSYDLHIDCIPSSNVGSIFAGHKLLAVWGFGDDSKAVVKSNGREHFAKPLTQSQVSALETAQCVALAPPGSAYIFSGACAHTVCNVGFSAPKGNVGPEPSLVASSYEAFVNLNCRHLKAVADTFDAANASDSDEDLEDFETDMAEGAAEIQERLKSNQVQEAKLAAAAVAYLKRRVPRVQRFLKEEGQEKDKDVESSEATAGDATAVAAVPLSEKVTTATPITSEEASRNAASEYATTTCTAKETLPDAKRQKLISGGQDA